jgi:hypothetical protein
VVVHVVLDTCFAGQASSSGSGQASWLDRCPCSAMASRYMCVCVVLMEVQHWCSVMGVARATGAAGGCQGLRALTLAQ